MPPSIIHCRMFITLRDHSRAVSFAGPAPAKPRLMSQPRPAPAVTKRAPQAAQHLRRQQMKADRPGRPEIAARQPRLCQSGRIRTDRTGDRVDGANRRPDCARLPGQKTEHFLRHILGSRVREALLRGPGSSLKIPLHGKITAVTILCCVFAT